MITITLTHDKAREFLKAIDIVTMVASECVPLESKNEDHDREIAAINSVDIFSGILATEIEKPCAP